MRAICRSWGSGRLLLLGSVVVAAVIGAGILHWRRGRQVVPDTALSDAERDRLRERQEELIGEAVLLVCRDFTDPAADLRALAAAQEKMQEAIHIGERLGEDVTRHRKVLSNYQRMEALIRQDVERQQVGRCRASARA